MSKDPKPRPGPWRRAFRWVRIVFLFAVFLVVAAAAYLNLVGLPDFLKTQLLQRLSERGFEVQFSSARLGLGAEVLVDNASFHRADRPLGPRLSAGQTRIRLNPDRLLKGRVAVDSLYVSQGQLELPFSLAPGDFLSVNDVFLDLDLLPNDTIRLNNGRATFHGVQVTLHGAITNYLTARKIVLWPSATRTNVAGRVPPDLQTENQTLRRLASTLDQIHFSAPPKIALTLTADAHDFDTLLATLEVEAGGAQTPWGNFTGLKMRGDSAHPVHPGTNSFVRLGVLADVVQTPQTEGKKLSLTGELFRLGESNLQAAIHFATDDYGLRPSGMGTNNSFTARQVRWDGNIKLQPTPFAVLAAGGKLHAAQVATPWAKMDLADVTENAGASPGATESNPGWGFWNTVNHWAFDWQADMAEVNAYDVRLNRLESAGSWQSPRFELTRMEADLYGGKLTNRTQLDVATRAADIQASFGFEYHQLASRLPPAEGAWLDDTTWQSPPLVTVAAQVELPAWTNRAANWADELVESLQMAGAVSANHISYRGFEVDSIQTQFTCTNQAWSLSHLHLRRPDAELALDFSGGKGPSEYSAVIDSKMDPSILRPFLPDTERRYLDFAQFASHQPPEIHAELKGRPGDANSVALRASLTATNFTAHGEKGNGLVVAGTYSNSTFEVKNLRFYGDGGDLTADYAGGDLTARKFVVSNAVSTIDPHIVNRLLGSNTPTWYRVIGFDLPPTIRGEGSFVVGHEELANLDFQVSGQKFRYDHLLADRLSGEVRWHGRHVELTNVQGSLYHGTAAATGVFDYQKGGATTFRGHTAVRQVELSELVRSWGTNRSKVEGILDADATVTDGSSTNRHSWVGRGHVSINHAVLWNIKLFGIFSQMLNKIVPGSGNDRAYQASADLVLTNAMMTTTNLEIRSTDFRLVYKGSVDMDKNLDARVEAKLLRDTPLLGRVVSWALSPLSKLFEYKISGTLEAPVTRPVYLPRALTILTEPFHKRKPEADTDPSAATSSPGQQK